MFRPHKQCLQVLFDLIPIVAGFALIARSCYACNWSADNNDVTTLTDLQLSVPFTYVETYYNIVNCSSNPFTFAEWRTVYAAGSTYPGETVNIIVVTSMLFTYTFPDLILTLLSPGETFLMACPHIKNATADRSRPNDADTLVDYTLTVPIATVTPPPTITSDSITGGVPPTSSSTSSSRTVSSGLLGRIIGGITGLVMVAIIGFLAYMLRNLEAKHRRERDRTIEEDDERENDVSTVQLPETDVVGTAILNCDNSATKEDDVLRGGKLRKENRLDEVTIGAKLRKENRESEITVSGRIKTI